MEKFLAVVLGSVVNPHGRSPGVWGPHWAPAPPLGYVPKQQIAPDEQQLEPQHNPCPHAPADKLQGTT